MQDYNSAYAFVAALTQANPDHCIIDVRMIHDTDKATAAIPRRGTLPQLWNEIVGWNNAGYGVFININEMDGSGRYEIANVSRIRCQAIDLDTLSATENYHRACVFNPAPSFAVQSSPGKFHVYWSTNYHNNRDGFTLLQRKLRTMFDGDKTIIDPSRVLRLPGTYHLKNPAAPHLITCWSLANFNNPIDPGILEAALWNVNVVDGGGGRHELGDPELQAPGLDWCIRALQECDPNKLDRAEWISFSSAWKQAAWNFSTPEQLQELWLKWCERYTANDVAENLKNWNSIRNTEVGWPSIERRNPNLHAMRIFGEKQRDYQQQIEQQRPTTQPPVPMNGEPLQPSVPPVSESLPIPSGEFLTDTEQRVYFAGCTLITRMGEILIPDGRFFNATKFNAKYGGKKFIIDSAGKTTNEPWQAATRSTLWQIPQADHIRFIPSKPTGERISDALGRIGINTYKPAIIDAIPGDVTPFLRHVELLFPNEMDRKILFDYLAHNVKFPGFKIPWAPLIQSTEGAGKNAIKAAMEAAIGKVYCYEPKAKELIESGSTFNAWMRSKLFIIVDEIKTDERRDMIEILKPMISEEQIEVQAKGIDQELEDNFSNWCFFSNYKDAIPISKNSRRFAIFYSKIQSAQDLLDRGMNDQYFHQFYNGWLKVNGAKHVAHWLLNYPIERGGIPMRAPETSSTHEAVRQSRGPVEVLILDAIQDGLPGFRGGWVSSLALAGRLKGSSVRALSAKTLGTIMEGLGYHPIGRAHRPYWDEHKDMRADLWNYDRHANIADYGRTQGYSS